MSIHKISNRIQSCQTAHERTRTLAGRVGSGSAALVLALMLGCGGSGSGPDGGDETGSLAGTVQTTALVALEGATITVGARHATSDARGHFELTDLSTGSASVDVELAGYQPATTTISISAGANTHDFALTVNEIYEFGSSAVYVPAGVGSMRGVIVMLGGPITSGFVTGDSIVPPPGDPVLEASLQSLGGSLRALARSAHVALLGRTAHVANSSQSDAQLFDALGTVAGLSGHAEIAGAPLLMFGLSAGGPEAAGLVSRSPGRAIGLLLRVPIDATTLTDPVALAVPTFVMQAELDNNANAMGIFTGNRSRGGLWALAVEPGAVHAEASSEGNTVNVGWIGATLAARLPATAGDPLVALDEQSGWLGNQTTLEIAAWADYTGSRASASWLLSQSMAQSWQALQSPVGGGTPHRAGRMSGDSASIAREKNVRVRSLDRRWVAHP